MRTILKRTAICLCAVLLLAAALLTGAHLYLATQPGTQRLMDIINDLIPGTITGRTIDVSLLHQTAVIRDATLAGPDGRTILQAKRVTLALDLPAFLHNQLVFTSIRLDRPNGTLAIDADGRLNIVSAFKEETAEESALVVLIQRLEGTNGTLSFRLADDSDIRMQGLSLRLAAAFAKDVDLHLAIPSARLALRLPGRAIDCGTSSLSGSIVNDRIDDIRFTTQKNTSRVRLTGAVSDLTQKANLNLRLELDADPADFRPALGLPESITGRASGSLSATGAYDNPTMTWTLEYVPPSPTPEKAAVKENPEGPFLKKGSPRPLPKTFIGSGRAPDETAQRAVSSGARPERSKVFWKGAGETFFSKKVSPGSSMTASSGGWGIGAISFSGALRDRRVSCRALKADIASGVVVVKGDIDLRPVFPRGYFGGHIDREAVAYDLQVAGDGIRLADLPGGMRGTVGARLDVQGRGIKPATLAAEVAGTVQARGFSAGALKKTDIRIAGRGAYRGQTVFFAPVTAEAGGAMLTARGKAQLASRAIDGQLDLRASDIARLLAPYAIDARGAVQGRAVVGGTYDRPAARIVLDGHGCAWQAITIGEAHVDADLDRAGTVTVHAAVRNKASTITATGTVGLFASFPRISGSLPVVLKADLDAVNPADFAPRLRLAGAFSGPLSLAGDRASLAADLKLQGQDCVYADMPLGRLTVDAALQDGILHVAGLGLEKGRSAIAVAGTVQALEDDRLALRDDPGLDLELTAGRIFLEDFSNAAAGAVALTGEIRGTVKHPQGTAAVAGDDLDLGIQKVAALNLAARFDQDRLLIDPATAIIAAGQEIRGTGWITLDGAYAVALSSPGIALAALEPLQNRPGIAGTARFDLSGQGTLEDPHLSGTLVLQNLRFQDKPLPDGRLALDLSDERLGFTGTLGFALNGSYDWETREYAAALTFDHTDLAPYFALADRPTLRGAVSGTLKAAGKLGRLEGLDVSADLAGLAIALEEKPLIRAEAIKGSYRNGTLNLPRTALVLAESGSCVMGGSGTLKDGLVFDGAGVLPMEVVGAFVEELADARGDIRFTAQILSRADRTAVKALFTLQYCAYVIPYNGQRLYDLNGSIRMDDRRIACAGITGRLDSGTIKLSGDAALDDAWRLTDMHVHAQAKSVPVTIPDTMDLTVDADAALTAGPRRSLLKADVILLDGTYYKDVNLNLVTGVFERFLPLPKPLEKPAPTLPPFLRAMELDVALKRRGVLEVDNNIAALELNPDLKVAGTAQTPIVSGRVSVTEGTVTFQGNTFTVKRGVIDYTNPYRTEAKLDIVSETTVRDWTITLTLSGPPDNLLVELSSSPEEEQSDILSLLVIGKTSRELAQNQAGLTVSPSGMMAELLANTYGEEIKKATSLDILKVESSDVTGTETGTALKLTMGKELSRRLTLSYEMETKNSATVQRGIAEYKLLDNLLINGYQGSDGIFGAEVQLKHEFR